MTAWISTLVADGLKPGSVRQTHRVISLILDSAVADGRLGRNPAKCARLPRPVRKEPMYLSAEQVSALAQAAPSAWTYHFDSGVYGSALRRIGGTQGAVFLIMTGGG